MRRLRAWLLRVAGFVAPGPGERDFAAELQSHIDLQIDDHVRAGLSADEARRRALAAVGSVAAVQEAHRERRGLPALEALLRDLRVAVRTLARQPGFAAAAGATLAIGIGANAAVFSVVHSVLLAPLPYADPDRLVTIWASHPQVRQQFGALSRDNAVDLKRTLTTVSAFEMLQANLVPGSLPIDGERVNLQGAIVTPGMFDLLGTRPLLGRTLRDGDDSSAIVISYALWQRQFGGDPGVVGRRFGDGSRAATVVGVMPRGFTLPYPSMLQATVSFTASSDVDFWVPLTEPRSADRSTRLLAVVARARDDATLDGVRADLAVAWRQLVQAHHENEGWDVHAVPLHQQAVAPVRAAMWLLLGSVAIVLLIACVNVANLLLARGVARQQEMAMRAALGASRGRLMQQALIESLVLATLGAAAGFVIARWITPALVRWAPSGTPRLDEVAADSTVLLFTLIVAAICGLTVGLVPGLGLSRAPVREAIGNGTRATADGRRLRGLLVAAQVALAVVLTIGAALLVRSFVAVLSVDPGFQSDHLLTLGINLPPQYDSSNERLVFYERLFARLEAVPGVVSVGGTTRLPLGGANSTTQVAVEGRIPPDGQWPEVDFRRAVHRYFETIGVPLRRGRYFTDADGANAPPVVMINEAFARRLFGDEDPIGHTLRLGPSSPVRRATIVGIVGDLRHQRLDVAPVAEVYVYYRQAVPVAPLLVIRTSLDPASLAASIRSALGEVDASVMPSNVRTMDSLRSATVSERLFLLGLVSSFGALALLLAAIGVYGVLSLVVAERRRELGIRLALGASARGLVRMVVAQALRFALAGIAAGLTLAGLLTPIVASQLYGVARFDPATFAGVALLLLVVALAAAAVPAGRVRRVDPATTLRD